MIDLDRSLPEYGAFGFPCHGLVEGPQLTLPNGSTVSVSPPRNGDNWLLEIPGAPGAVRTPEQALADEARGWSWPNDILCWPFGCVHGYPLSWMVKGLDSITAGVQFIHAAAPGQCALVGVQAVDGGPAGRRLEVVIAPIRINGTDEPVVTVYADPPAGVPGELLSNYLDIIDVARRGDSAIVGSAVGARHLFHIRLGRADGVWGVEVDYLGGPTPRVRTAHTAEWKLWQAAVGPQQQSVEVLNGAWFVGDGEGGIEYYSEHRGVELRTPRVTYAAGISTPDDDPDRPLWPIGVRARDGEVRWNLGSEIVTAWFAEDGSIQLLERSAEYELTASTAFDIAASGDILISNATPYYADGSDMPLPAPPSSAWEDPEYLTGSLSLSIERSIRETVTQSLRLNGAVVESAELRRELQLATTSGPLKQLDPDLPYVLRGDTYEYDQLVVTAYRAQMNATVYVDGDIAGTAVVNGTISGGGPLRPEQLDATLLGSFGYPATYAGTLSDSDTVGPVGYLALRGQESAVYSGVHRYSNKLAALWTMRAGVQMGTSVHDAYSPLGFQPGTQQTVTSYPTSALRGSYNSRTGEAVTSTESLFNWV